MNPDLKNKRAFIAGASSGLGRAVAQALLEYGSRVAICSRDRDRIESAASELRIACNVDEDQVVPIVCDVTDDDDIRRAVAEAADTLGGIDLLVTNAGGPPAGRIDDFDADDWRKALDLNLMSTINLSRTALPHLRAAAAKRGRASILMISSLSAKQPVPSLYLSNVARSGVQGFAKSLSEELGPEGITVNTILPGYTRTDRLRHLSDHLSETTGKSVEQVEAGWADSAALKRIGTEQEFGATAAFLLSAWAGYITGVGLPVDGGAIKSTF